MTPRSLVGMTMGARKRAALYESLHTQDTSPKRLTKQEARMVWASICNMVSHSRAWREQVRKSYCLGQRLRPCPGCADCDPYMSSYGSFYGGDPRLFTPDEECSTDQERELHRKHCEEWARGERPSVKVSGVEWVDDITYQDSDGKTQTIKAGHKLVERAAYGLGVSRLTDDDSGLFCDGSGVLPAKGKARR